MVVRIIFVRLALDRTGRRQRRKRRNRTILIRMSRLGELTSAMRRDEAPRWKGLVGPEERSP